MSVRSSAALMRVLGASCSAARAACDVIREVLQSGDLQTKEKGGKKDDLQTRADRAAQMQIVAHMRKKFPQLKIIGEEDDDVSEDDLKEQNDVSECDEERAISKLSCPEEFADYKLSDLVLWVDPLDGTSEFTQGLLDHVTVLLGISARGKSVAGVVAQPYFDYHSSDGAKTRLCYGIVGLGLFGIDMQKPPAGKRIITTTRSHGTGIVAEAVELCEPSEVLKVGGCGHKVMLLLEGRAHAYVFASPGCKKWDTCAPEALLHAAGGWLTDIHGHFIQYYTDLPKPNLTGVLASVNDHQFYLDRVSPIKEKLPCTKPHFPTTAAT